MRFELFPLAFLYINIVMWALMFALMKLMEFLKVEYNHYETSTEKILVVKDFKLLR